MERDDKQLPIELMDDPEDDVKMTATDTAMIILIAAGLTALLQFDFGVIFAVAGLEVRVTAATVVPLLLLIVLVMYSADGAAMTRLMIIVVYGVSLVVLAFGLLYGLQSGKDWETTGRIASLMGAYNIERPGTQNHRFTLDEFRERFRDEFRYDFA